MAYSGITAKIVVGSGEGTQVAYISNFSIEETKDILEITKLGSPTKEKIASMYSWTASADGTADFETDVAQTTLRNAMISGTPVTVKFYLSDSRTLTGEALVESMSIDLSAEDKGNISISLSGSGALTMNAAPQA